MTYAQRVLPEAIHTDVERAIAFGHSDQWITTHYNVTVGDIANVQAYMDAVVDEPDSTRTGPLS